MSNEGASKSTNSKVHFEWTRKRVVRKLKMKYTACLKCRNRRKKMKKLIISIEEEIFKQLGNDNIKYGNSWRLLNPTGSHKSEPFILEEFFSTKVTLHRVC